MMLEVMASKVQELSQRFIQQKSMRNQVILAYFFTLIIYLLLHNFLLKQDK
jgi:hypothetical protein